MKIRKIDKLDKLPPAQNAINLLPYGIFGEVNFKKQLTGGAKQLVNGGRMSKKLGGITLIGADTDNCSIKRKSVLVYEGGRLVAICDMNEQDEKYAPSFGYKIVNFADKKVGVLVHKDIFLPDAVKSLVFCGCSAIIDLYGGFLTKKVQVSAEFYAYVYGIDFVVLARDTFFAYSSDGERAEGGSDGTIELRCERRYREVRTKRSGNF